ASTTCRRSWPTSARPGPRRSWRLQPSPPVPEPAATTTWAAALDEFAAVLERNEQRLAADRWDDLEPAGSPAGPRGTPSSADRARGAALLARAAAQERRLRAELDATAAALGDLGLRRTAARRYTS